MSKSEYEISRDEYFANAENLVKGSLKVDRKTVLAERESFYYALINKAKDVGGTNIGIEFKMYKNILADYTGEHAGLGELYSLELEQRKEAQITE